MESAVLSVPPVRRRDGGVALWLGALAASAWFSYLTLLAFQLMRIWRVWDWRDMTGGDTCAYFLQVPSMRVNFAYSPLYTTFWGILWKMTDDAAASLMLHRVLIVLVSAALVLAVLRRILPAPVAWLVAAWWAVLPINFDTMYEVHLFALIPLLVTLLVIWGGRSAWSRGAAVGLMVLCALLVRNEMIVGVAALGAACGFADWRRRTQNSVADFPRRFSPWPYLVPMALALGLAGWFYYDSDFKGQVLLDQMHSKHIVSMGQAYALGYAERHRHWTKNPWPDFADACQADFGMPYPTLTDMIRANPKALAVHMLWNLRLAPSSLQLLLFQRAGGRFNPDITPQILRSPLAWIGTAAALALIALAWARRRSEVWREMFADRAFEWFASLACIVFVVPVALLVRPRPAYLYSAGVLLMAFLGACAVVAAGRWRGWRQWGALMPGLMIALPILVPHAYGSHKHHGPQPLLDTYERLKPLQKQFARSDSVYLGAYAVELHNYLGFGRGQVIDLSALAALPADQPLVAYLDREHVTTFYIDSEFIRRLDLPHVAMIRAFFNGGVSAGWQVVAGGREQGGWWLALRRRTAGGAAHAALPVRLQGFR